MSEHWIINSDHTETAFIASVKQARAEHGYITYSAPRIGKDRSLDQNALFHVWCAEYAAHLLNKTKKDVTKGELSGMKRVVKIKFNTANSNNFMIDTITDPFTGDTKRDYTSSADWKSGEAFIVMEWLQLHAANDGLILESLGQYDKLKRKQTSV
jgi:hypothetical protein